MENSDGKVAERVVKKLRVEPPAPELVTAYLKEIAMTYGVSWPKNERTMAEEEEDEDDNNPSSGQAVKILEEPLPSEELSKATPPRDLGPKSPVSIAPPSPSTDNISPRIRLPGPPELKPSAKMSAWRKQTSDTGAAANSTSNTPGGQKDIVGGKIPDVDELAKRFANLKR